MLLGRWQMRPLQRLFHVDITLCASHWASAWFSCNFWNLLHSLVNGEMHGSMWILREVYNSASTPDEGGRGGRENTPFTHYQSIQTTQTNALGLSVTRPQGYHVTPLEKKWRGITVMTREDFYPQLCIGIRANYICKLVSTCKWWNRCSTKTCFATRWQVSRIVVWKPPMHQGESTEKILGFF